MPMLYQMGCKLKCIRRRLRFSVFAEQGPVSCSFSANAKKLFRNKREETRFLGETGFL